MNTKMKLKIYWLVVLGILVLLAFVWEAEKKFVQKSRTEINLGNFVQRRSLGIQCYLCNFECYLPEGEIGKCRNKLNLGGQLLFWDIPLFLRSNQNQIQ